MLISEQLSNNSIILHKKMTPITITQLVISTVTTTIITMEEVPKGNINLKNNSQQIKVLMKHLQDNKRSNKQGITQTQAAIISLKQINSNKRISPMKSSIN